MNNYRAMVVPLAVGIACFAFVAGNFVDVMHDGGGGTGQGAGDASSREADPSHALKEEGG
jgi:hypothetical protein